MGKKKKYHIKENMWSTRKEQATDFLNEQKT